MASLNAIGSGLDTASNDRAVKIKKLKAKLINEEHRLVLMKKIRQSQTRPVNQQQQLQQQQQQQQRQQQQQQQRQQQQQSKQASQQHANIAPNQLLNNINSQTTNPAKKLKPNLPANNISHAGSNNLLLTKNQLNHVNNYIANLPPGSSSTNQTPAHAHQRAKSNNVWNQPPQMRQPTPAGIAPPHVGNLNRNPITTPPNVVQAMIGSLNANQQSLLMNQINALTAAASPGVGGLLGTPGGSANRRSAASNLLRQQPITTSPNVIQDVRGSHAASTPFNKSQAAQLLVQRRASAKQAIQKQLEATLMQLPQKHIQLDIDFVPNANNVEFVCYIGLEACVDYLTNTKNPMDTQPLEKPFECSTCGTDFTPSWSWKRSNPVCENCVSNYVKKSIKNSQANRIKSALAKAAKQEQEIDQKVMAEAASVVTSPATPATSSISTSVSNTSRSRHSSLLQPVTSQPQTPNWTPRSSQQQHYQQQQQQHHQSTLSMNRTTPSSSSSTTPSSRQPAANILPNLNLNNPLAALGSLPPAALASLLQMNPQFSTLASLMANNAAVAPPPPPPPPPVAPPPPPVSTSNNTNQIAQVAALLMNQLTAMFQVNNGSDAGVRRPI